MKDLNLLRKFQYDDNVAEGNVISTTPAAHSKAAKDTQVKMIVSKGAQKKDSTGCAWKNLKQMPEVRFRQQDLL